MYFLLLLRSPTHGDVESSPDLALVDSRYFGIDDGGLVRDPHQHLRKQPHGIRFSERQAVLGHGYSASFRHVLGRVVDLRRTLDDDLHPLVRSA